MAYAYDSGLIDRIMPRIKQYEATTGRKISQSMLDALMKGQLSAEVDKAQQTRALDLQETQFANTKEQQDKANKAAQTKGYIDTATTAGTLGLAYYALNKPSAMSEYLAAMKGGSAVAPTATSTAAIDTAAGSSFASPSFASSPYSTFAAPTAAAPTIAGPTTFGAQTTLAGGAPVAIGGQTVLAGGAEAGSMAAYDASLAAGAAEGVGSTAGTAGAGASFGLSSLAAPVAGWGVGSLADMAIQKWSPVGGAKEKSIAGNVAKGAGVGAGIGSVVPVVGTAIGAVIGGVIGLGVGLVEDVSVICSELLRQGHITEKQRTACVVFRYRHIPDDMFDAYLEWAKPIVAIMRRGGIRNKILLPFAKAFIGYMIALQTGKVPTTFERTVWKYAWWRCEAIARRNAQSVLEVA